MLPLLLLMASSDPLYLAVCERDAAGSRAVLVASINYGVPTALARAFEGGREDALAAEHKNALRKLLGTLRKKSWYSWGNDPLHEKWMSNANIRETESTAGKSIALVLGGCILDDKAGQNALIYATSPLKNANADVYATAVDPADGSPTVVRGTGTLVTPAAITQLLPTRFEARVGRSDRTLIVDRSGIVVPCTGDCERTADFSSGIASWCRVGDTMFTIAPMYGTPTRLGYESGGGYSGGLDVRLISLDANANVRTIVASLSQSGC